MKKKVFKLSELDKKLSIEKKQNKKIVLCHGVFDLLHLGHIRHFREAKTYGDILVVSITPDKYVNKGPGRPAFNEKYRAEALSHLKNIDYVTINNSATAVNVIKKIKPKIYCKGPDYKDNKKDITGEIKNEIKAINKCNGKIVYTKDITFSSSKLINEYGDLYSQSQKSFIKTVAIFK